jgi:chromosome segregation ATPase
MTDNLVLEHLKHIRKAVDHLTEDIQDLKMRVSSVERSTALLHYDLAQVNGRLDGFDKRLTHIESRLDLRG